MISKTKEEKAVHHKVSELELEHQVKLDEYLEKWRYIGLNTDEAEPHRAVPFISAIYKNYGLRMPNYVFVADSPLSAAISSSTMLDRDEPTAFLGKELSYGGLAAHSNMSKYVTERIRGQIFSKFTDQVETDVSIVRDGIINHVIAVLDDMEWKAVDKGIVSKKYQPITSAADTLENRAYFSGTLARIAGNPLGYDKKMLYSDPGSPNAWNIAKGRSVVIERVKEQSLGSMIASTIGCYDYANAVLGVPVLDETFYKMSLAKFSGWWAGYRDFVILQHRPEEIHFNSDGDLHNEFGPAITYRDGFSVYYWRGERLDPQREWIIHSPEKITLETLREERNTEFRRMMLEKMGPDRFFQQADANLVDWDDYNLVGLYEIQNTPWGRIQVTESTCHTTGRKYVEFLGDEIFTSVQDALRWQFDVEDYDPQSQS